MAERLYYDFTNSNRKVTDNNGVLLLQCESKNAPPPTCDLQFCDIFSQTVENFKSVFYTPIYVPNRCVKFIKNSPNRFFEKCLKTAGGGLTHATYTHVCDIFEQSE